VAIGFRPHVDVLRWLAAAGVMAACVLTLSWISAAFGVLARAPEAASGFTFFLSSLTYPTSAFVPVDTMPRRLQGFARNQPLTHAIEAVRALLLDRPVGSHVVLALVWCAGLTVASVLVATLLYRRRTG
jgi:ABC-2 type transport system permease protein